MLAPNKKPMDGEANRIFLSAILVLAVFLVIALVLFGEFG